MEVAILSFIKYRIGEMAKDFGVPTKTVTALVGEFFEKPKSGQQVLTEEQLNVLFDVLTQRHQVASLEETLAAQQQPKAEAAPAAPKEAPAPKAEKAEPEKKPAQPAPQQQPKADKPAQQPKAEKPKEPERKRERRVIDTSAVTVNANRFDDRVDALVSERVQNYSGGKQKIGNKNKQQSRNKFAGNKRRNEEQEKMRRLQLEVAKKAPLVVKIPD